MKIDPIKPSPGAAVLVAMLVLASAHFSGIGGCGSKEKISDKTEAQELIQSFDVNPQPDRAIDGLKAGCEASSTDLIKFMEAFLSEVGIDPDLAGDPDVQESVDNLENFDTSDLPGSCATISSL